MSANSEGQTPNVLSPAWPLASVSNRISLLMGESVERTDSDRGRHEEKGGVREKSKESDRTHVTGKNRKGTGGWGLSGVGNTKMGRQPKISMYENAIKEGKYCKTINKKKKLCWSYIEVLDPFDVELCST